MKCRRTFKRSLIIKLDKSQLRYWKNERSRYRGSIGCNIRSNKRRLRKKYKTSIIKKCKMSKINSNEK